MKVQTDIRGGGEIAPRIYSLSEAFADFIDQEGLAVKVSQQEANLPFAIDLQTKYRKRLQRSASRKNMTVEECLAEWMSKKRSMGCVMAAEFICSRVPGFYPVRLNRDRQDGIHWQHVVASNDEVVVDLSPAMDYFDLS